MSELAKTSIVAAVFLCIAFVGIALSYAAPYMLSGDEIVYLTGALEARDHNLPDARMLEGTDYGPYLYPKVMLAWYERLGHDVFKSIALVVLVLAAGLGVYGMFRILWLPWAPALALAAVALMPRFAAGLEIFGTLTFRDAIGRQSALPLFFIATGFLIRRFAQNKSLWPVFGIVGLGVFLHPVSVMLFAAASLVTLFVARLWYGGRALRAMAEVLLCGATFVLGGAYLFIEVLPRLSASVSGSVSQSAYVQSVLARNAWDFPQGALPWFVHMGFVSALFALVLCAFYWLPRLRIVREAHPMKHGRLVLAWGLCLAAAALILSVALPGINLYLMEHADAPYIFQQWSRIAKFYYLGLFIALVPAAYSSWRWYVQSTYRFKKIVLAAAVAAGVLNSTPGFEMAQFALGYPNYDKAYVPQALSGAQDGIAPQEYQEACQALRRLGAAPEDEVISGDFALRYYCRANLYVTNEEGGAYTQLGRDELVAWHKRLLRQRDALSGTDPQKLFEFARAVGARYAVLGNTPANVPFAMGGAQVIETSRHLVLRIP